MTFSTCIEVTGARHRPQEYRGTEAFGLAYSGFGEWCNGVEKNSRRVCTSTVSLKFQRNLVYYNVGLNFCWKFAVLLHEVHLIYLQNFSKISPVMDVG